LGHAGRKLAAGAGRATGARVTGRETN
jgi:hypothetical protein